MLPLAPHGADVVHALSLALSGSAHLPARLRDALVIACDDRRSIRTVARLASAAGCDRRTLWTHWKQSVGARSRLRLQDFLHWLLLLRAARFKRDDDAWADVAVEIGVHPHTLGRLARQLTGRTLRDLSEVGPAVLARRFEAEVVPQLLDGGTVAPPAD
jgi:hypothetical protein